MCLCLLLKSIIIQPWLPKVGPISNGGKFCYKIHLRSLREMSFFHFNSRTFYVTFMHFFASTRPSGAPLVPTPFCIGEELLQTRWYLKINALAILGKSTKDSYPRVPGVKSFIFGEELPKISSF